VPQDAITIGLADHRRPDQLTLRESLVEPLRRSE